MVVAHSPVAYKAGSFGRPGLRTSLIRVDLTMRRTALPLAVAIFLVPAAAQASGFSTARFGAEHGTPVSANPTALYYNPAAIAEAEGFRIFVDGSFAFRAASFTHSQAATDTNEPAGAEGANYGQATLFNFAAAPFIGATYRLPNGLAFGASFSVPFGGSTVWDQNKSFTDNPTFAGPVDGVQRWHTIEGTLRSMFVTAAVAYRIEAARLSLGLSGNVILSSMDTIRARTSDGANDVEREGRSWLSASGLSGSFGVGAMWEAVPKTLWIGASYQTRPGVVGGLSLDGKLTNKLSAGDPTVQEVTVKQDLPDVIRFGVKVRPVDKLELRLFGDVHRWSAFENQCLAPKGEDCKVDPENGSAAEGSTVVQNIPRHWQDAFGLRAGASLYPTDAFEIMVGAGYDGNAIPDATLDPSISDFDDISFAVGGRVKIVKQLAVALTYTHLFYIPRNTTGKSETATTFIAPSNGPDAGGVYTQSIGVINANVEAVF